MLSTREAYPEVYMRDVGSTKPLTIGKIKQLLIEEEANIKEIRKRENATEKAMLVNSNVRRGGSNFRGARKTAVTCHKCSLNGHIEDNCTSDKWRCYNCGKFTDIHISANCPDREKENSNTLVQGKGVNRGRTTRG